MQPALYQHDARQFTGSRRSRLGAGVLSLAVLALIFLMMIAMGVVDLGTSGAGARLVSISLSGSSSTEHRRTQAHKSASHHTTVPQPHPVQAEPKPVPPHPIWLSHDDFAAADISRLPKHQDDSADTSSQDSHSTYGPGEGPGGAQLFNADWYREPSNAELGGYMPASIPPGSWATIACRMVEHYHVEDCQELDESPPGSGLARGLRNAAWQFLVRPPQVNGKPQLGTWVRIRFDFTRNRAD
jgi:protein TonB